MTVDSRLVNLDVALAAHIAPKIRAFAKSIDGYPASLASTDEWKDALDRMAWSFEFAQTEAYFTPNADETARFSEGMSVFAQHFEDLWI